MRLGLLVLTSLMTISCAVFGIRSEAQPPYEVLLQDGNKEIRQYHGYLVATTWVAGEYEAASTQGFRRLFKYISGHNSTQGTIAMTAPVLQTQEQQGWSMAFVMPATYTITTLPRPLDDRITLHAVTATHVAVLRYTWGTDGDKIAGLGQELLRWADTQTGYEATSKPRSARYDPPFTLPFLRRNEIHVDVGRTLQ
jgi:hypothetical protein